jgi:hypothetical protein
MFPCKLENYLIYPFLYLESLISVPTFFFPRLHNQLFISIKKYMRESNEKRVKVYLSNGFRGLSPKSTGTVILWCVVSHVAWLEVM